MLRFVWLSVYFMPRREMYVFFRTQADFIGCILHLTAGVINRFSP